MDKQEIRDLVKTTVHETLMGLGADPSKPLEMQKDFQAMREFRVTLESIKKKALLTLVGTLILSVLAIIGVGLKGYFGR